MKTNNFIGGVKMKKGLIFAVLLVALCSSIAGCGTAVGLGLSAVKSGIDLYSAGSGNSQEQEERYDAAIHRYYTVDKDGNRQYK